MRPGYNVGGKTGTSQTIDPATGKYTEDKTVGSYLGYGGDSVARYVIMVRVGYPTLAPAVCGKRGRRTNLFGELSNWLIDYYNIKPM